MLTNPFTNKPSAADMKLHRMTGDALIVLVCKLTQHEEAQLHSHDGHQDVWMHGQQAVSGCNKQTQAILEWDKEVNHSVI